MNSEDKTPDGNQSERPDSIVNQPNERSGNDGGDPGQFDPFRSPEYAEVRVADGHVSQAVSTQPLRHVIGNVVDSWYACLAVPVLGIIAGFFVSAVLVIILVVAFRASGGQLPSNPNDLVMKLAENPAFLMLLLLPNQLVFFFVAIGIARYSNHNLSDRLALGVGSGSMWTWPVYILATPLVGLVISALLSLVAEQESGTMKFVEDLINAQGASRLLLLIMLIAAVPGICEEVLFRGFSQTFLAKQWPVPAAICASSALFAIAHVDPLQVIAVFPLGVWFGVITWRTKSIIPAVLCHFFNNFVSVMFVQYNVEEMWGTALLWQFGVASGVFFLWALWLFVSRDNVGVGRGNTLA